jgi:hypothetical protein
MKTLHNKWALWLDAMSFKINNVYKSTEKKAEIFANYGRFEQEILKETTQSQNGTEGLIKEHGELIKLSKYNLEQGKFSQAKANCKAITQLYGDPFSAFAYYYGTMAEFNAKKKGGTVMSTSQQKREAALMLKKAAFLFERDIESIKMRSYVMACIRNQKLKGGIGSQADYFTRSNINEIAAIQV